MYVPSHFAQTDPARLHGLIRDFPLATLVTHGARGLQSDPVPLQLIERPGGERLLRGHVARANPLWRNHDPASDVLAVFSGPQAYITPSWYATKREHGRVVPTWNYTVVQARGRLRVIEDAEWLHALLTSLTTEHETRVDSDWQVGDAPDEFVARLLEAIVGIEIVVSELTGKWKHSQNQPAANRDGVVDGLVARGDPAAQAAAALVARGNGASGDRR